MRQRRRAAAAVSGERVAYVVNRNINYTNVCYFRCQFCAFSKGKLIRQPARPPLRPRARRDPAPLRAKPGSAAPPKSACRAASIPTIRARPISRSAAPSRRSRPDIHIHAFSPLEVTQGAHTLGLTVAAFLRELKAAGLGTLPGTAAEILDDEVRRIICPDKINTQQWLDVVETAHAVGLRTTATIMYGHVEGLQHWARHLLAPAAPCRSAPAA